MCNLLEKSFNIVVGDMSSMLEVVGKLFVSSRGKLCLSWEGAKGLIQNML